MGVLNCRRNARKPFTYFDIDEFQKKKKQYLRKKEKDAFNEN